MNLLSFSSKKTRKSKLIVYSVLLQKIPKNQVFCTFSIGFDRRQRLGSAVLFRTLSIIAILSILGGALWRPALSATTNPGTGQKRHTDSNVSHIKVLNGFVSELLNRDLPKDREFLIKNPHESWLLISINCSPSASSVKVIFDEKEFSLRPVGNAFETMRYVSEGPHRIKVHPDTPADRLIVRSIPELFYSEYGTEPLVSESGRYTWEWLEANVLDNYNSIIGISDTQKQESEIVKWTASGRRWFTQNKVPWVSSAREVYEYWAKQPGMNHPQLSGIWADEFSFGEKYAKMYPIWCDALRQLSADPKFKGRKFYGFMGMTFHDPYRMLINTIMECGYRLAPEWYLREQPSEEQARTYIGPTHERKNRAAFESAYSRAAENRVIVLGLLSQPEESCDVYPDVNFNVYLDLQLHIMANDPAFSGTRGLLGYYSRYVGEEQTRLFARLLRHYAIEGRTERMLSDPYALTHISNPDFVKGTAGWDVFPAVEGSVRQKTVNGFGWLQGRYVRNGLGDTALWTKRSLGKPNVFQQEMKNLEPGRLYSLRFFTGNYSEYLKGSCKDYKHAVHVRIDSADVLPEKCFQTSVKSNYAHEFQSFNRKNPFISNYHQLIFRARAKTAQLVFSDWLYGTAPGGPEGEELIWNFIQVQPYFEQQRHKRSD